MIRRKVGRAHSPSNLSQDDADADAGRRSLKPVRVGGKQMRREALAEAALKNASADDAKSVPERASKRLREQRKEDEEKNKQRLSLNKDEISEMDPELLVNTATHVAMLSAVIVAAGALNFGFVVLIIMIVIAIGHRYREDKADHRRETHRIQRASQYRIQDVLHRPPPWVRFSQTERCKFLSDLIEAMWPFVRDPLESTIRNKIDTLLRVNKPAQLKSLSCTVLSLGHRPIAIQGANVVQV